MKKGFTLVELLVSLVLVAVVLTSMSAALVKLKSTYDKANDVTDIDLVTSSITRIISKDILSLKELVAAKLINEKTIELLFSDGKKRTITIENIDNILKLTKTVFLNGPAGAFEYDNFSYGTKEVLKSLKNSSAKVIIGGGDSASAAIKFGYKNSFYHISTGGGASLEFLSGKDMPGFENIGE